jgi:hypothetical protein
MEGILNLENWRKFGNFNRIDLIKYKIRSILLFYKIFKILV